MSNELRKNLPDDVVARLEALQKVEEVTEETHVEKNLPKMELPIWFDGKQINEILLYQTILGINQRDIGRENRSLKMRKLKNY